MKWLVRVNKTEQLKDLGKKSTAVDWLGHVKAKNLHFTSNLAFPYFLKFSEVRNWLYTKFNAYLK